jgi:hypothetical protein
MFHSVPCNTRVSLTVLYHAAVSYLTMCHVAPYHITLSHIISYHITVFQATVFHILLYFILVSCITLCRIVPYYTTLSYIAESHAVLCHITTLHITVCLNAPCNVALHCSVQLRCALPCTLPHYIVSHCSKSQRTAPCYVTLSCGVLRCTPFCCFVSPCTMSLSLHPNTLLYLTLQRFDFCIIILYCSIVEYTRFLCIPLLCLGGHSKPKHIIQSTQMRLVLYQGLLTYIYIVMDIL